MEGETARDGRGEYASDERLSLLLDTVAEVASTLDLESLLVRVVDRSLELTRAEWGILILGAEGEESLVVGDVIGHGLEAALYMLTARAGLRSSFAWVDEPSQVFEHLSRELNRDMDFGEGRLREAVRKRHDQSSRAIVEGVLEDVTQFMGAADPDDDRTIVVLTERED